jgi:hypothetical protein
MINFGIDALVAELLPTTDTLSTIGESLKLSTAFNTENLVAGLLPSADIMSTIAESVTAYNRKGVSAIPELLPALKIRSVIPKSFPLLRNDCDEISCENVGSKILIKPLLKGFKYDYIEYDSTLKELIFSCSILQGLAKNIHSDEDSRNSILAAMLERRGIIVKDQTRWGRSATGISCGELDFKIQGKKGITVAVCEAFILKSLEKNNIIVHLMKLFGYDPNGLKQNFIIIYSEANNFNELWKKYLLYVPEINFQYPLLSIEDVSNELSDFAEIKIALAMHLRNGNITKIYHIFMNMNI